MIELDAGFTKHNTKLDFALERKGATSWRPDKYIENPNGKGTEIKGYITDIQMLINQCASDLEDILTALGYKFIKCPSCTPFLLA